MSNDENREKNEEKAAVPVQPIIDMGSTVVKNSRGTIHCLTIVGQVEGHTLLPDNLKSTKYEHVLPLLAALWLCHCTRVRGKTPRGCWPLVAAACMVRCM